jgi:tripartite-type tricarboxylate transporter receptor subunit TctC
MGKRLLRYLCVAFSFVLLASGLNAASAQSYPTKSIRLVVAAPPGGGTDFIARLIGQHLSIALGQSVVIDNRGGAGGNIAAEIVARAPADGYTLLMVAASHAINPSLYHSLSYDPVKDFTPITEVAANPYVLVVNPSIPATTVKEFAAFAKSKKPEINYSSAGIGQASHLGMEMLKSMMGFDAVHIPYEGGLSAVPDLVSGRIDASLWSAPTALPLIKSGKVRALAVTSPKRLDLLPDVPTISESGYSGFEIGEWKGLLAPTGTPQEAITRIYEETAKVLQLPDVKERMAAAGQNPIGSTPQEFAVYIQREMARYAKAVKDSGATAN